MAEPLRSGSYRGSAESLTFDIRVEASSSETGYRVSGDVHRDERFIASFVGDGPFPSETDRILTGPVRFRGNADLHTGSIRLFADERGTGSFQLHVHLQGGYEDVFAGRLDWEGSFLRRLQIEIDGLAGTEPPTDYVNAGGKSVSLETAFDAVGYDVLLNVDPFTRIASSRSRMRGFTPAEIHAAMEEMRSRATRPGFLLTHVFVCSFLAGRNGRDVLGLMYDFGEVDQNNRPREGIAVFYDHPMLSDPRVPEDDRRREYVFTVVHEVGHALNLLHSFDRARPSALSWMNYPNLYPMGYEAGSEHDGAREFWRQFTERFDDEELRHLKHGSQREVGAGGFAFGRYEDGATMPLGTTAQVARTPIGANPLRVVPGMALRLGRIKSEYRLAEPVLLDIDVVNEESNRARTVPDALDPSEGYLRLTIRRPDGKVTDFRPPLRLCKQAQVVSLEPGQPMNAYSGSPIFLSADGPVFTEPGTYYVRAHLMGVDGYGTIESKPVAIRIATPDQRTERFAEEAWNNLDAMKALYLRHPLAAREAWEKLEEEAKSCGIDEDSANSTWSYMNYIAGVGWLQPFQTPGRAEPLDRDPERAAKKFRLVNTEGLPQAVANRIRGLESERDRPSPARKGKRPLVRAKDIFAETVPPSGLFGAVGLSGAREPRGGFDPFARVVSTLRGTKTFADIVSWNIEHLHSPQRRPEFPKIASLIRSFRCDFWGLQEVDEKSVHELVDIVNSSGQTRYAFLAVPGSGQQSGCLYRTDTTRVERLAKPAKIFDGKIKVKPKGKAAVERKVFLRDPLLASVRVNQGDRVYDFRVAVVHLKSTDTSLEDTGSGMRLAAANALADWIEKDRKSGQERDYLIMGDMNAETAQQGLEGFTKKSKLALLSVGMKQKYGEDNALTRVASKRLLDHIVITKDSDEKIPPVDKKEQIIIRSDRTLADWTDAYSDHIPVAVRFVLGEDADV